MKSLTLLLREVLADAGTWCGVSTARDYKTITSRFEHEGLSFLTITLPAFATDLQKGLAQGSVDHDMFQGFSWHAGLPRFCGGFLDLVFDRGSGQLLDDPSVDAIRAIRQICMFAGKLNAPCSPLRERRAIEGYIKCEQDVRDAESELSEREISQFSRVAALLFNDVLQVVDEDIYYGRHVPSHGPGSTADRLKGNEKWNQSEWTDRLEPYFPHGEFLAPSWRYFHRLDHVNILEPGKERPVKVVLVPKTLKTPRVIAMEPTCMMYAQKAIEIPLRRAISSHILSNGTRNPVAGVIGFSDQDRNRDLARIGSRTKRLATLDLSEASDRVSNQLVQLLMLRHPHLNEAVQASRSRKADVPGHGVIRLAKFASMGSALCFPVEALVFATIVFCGIEQGLNRRLTRKDLQVLSRQVRVYGDDIIVPTEHAQFVADRLEDFGLLVNRNKSFWSGSFRESCGGDYYDGEDVTPVRLRRFLPTTKQHHQEILSAVALRNLFYKAGYWGTASYLDGILDKLIPFPYVTEDSPVHGKLSFLTTYEVERIDDKLQRPEVFGIVEVSKSPTSELDDIGAMMKVFVENRFSTDVLDPVTSDPEHLQRAGRPRTALTKARWETPY